MLILVVLSLTFGLSARSGEAAPINIAITVRISGLAPGVATTVYVNGTAQGTVNGEGTLTLYLKNYTQAISVDSSTPSGYPYYGYSYYTYPGSSWSPYGNNGVAFVCYSPSQTVYGTSSTVSFTYDPYFYLYVKSDRGNPRGTGWYHAGTVAPISVDSPVEESSDTRYRFDKWVGGNLRDNTNNPANYVYMDSPKMIEAAWVTQYKLTVTSQQGSATGGGWYDKDQAASFSVNSPVDSGQGVRYVFTSWTGDYTGSALTGSVAMNGPKTVTATWKTQYLLTIDPNGGQVDKDTQWADSGTSIPVTASSPCNVVEKNSRSVFQGWQGTITSTSNPITVAMDEPKTLKAIWKTQYYLVVGTKRGVATGEGWYDANSTAEFFVPPEVAMEEPWGTLGGKYVFSGWTGDITGNTPGSTIVMDGAHIVTATWSSDYTRVAVFFAVVGTVAVAAVVLVFERGKLKGLSVRTHGLRSNTKGAPSRTNNSVRSRINGLLKRKKNNKP